MLGRFLLLFVFFTSFMFAATVLTDDKNRYENFSIEYLYDAQGELSIDEVSKHAFKATPSQFCFGYLNGEAWFKITLLNKSRHNDFILYFTEPLWEEFDLYESDGKAWKISHAGLLTPLDKRQINDVNPAFYIGIANDENKTFYIRGKSVSAQIGEFQLFTHDEFFRPTRFNITELYIFYAAIILIFAFFNLYLLIASKDVIYAYYIGYLFSFSLWITILSGAYLIFGFTAWNDGLHASGTLFVLFITLFSDSFLELKHRLPRIHRLFTAFALLFILFGIAIIMNVPFSSFLFNIASSLFVTLLLIISIKVWLEGHIHMRYYLIALIIYMPTMAMMTLTYNGLIDNTDITRYSFILGSFIELLFFNSLMISRYHFVFNEKIRIQKELLQEKEKNEKILENEIETRIKELSSRIRIFLAKQKSLSLSKRNWQKRSQLMPCRSCTAEDILSRPLSGVLKPQNVTAAIFRLLSLILTILTTSIKYTAIPSAMTLSYPVPIFSKNIYGAATLPRATEAMSLSFYCRIWKMKKY